ncbi:hypothetical protein ACVGVM_12975 [Pseudonocardia bannensis]|uniref:DUF2993 domain-containing protein n=1 Tax=Pseudonocardia bannensis TaxID=630973 RepID=A0A848DRW9_9PSEU|nr:hypothetical protein [Pseudonocardia bannensis]NMH95617.1 hypothetical protein [Pseudonocardia bannensis]
MVAATPVGALDALLRTAARKLVGRRFTVPGTGGDLVLRLESLQVRPDPIGLGLGQFDDVRVVATDLEWCGTACRRLVVVWRNVHVRPLPVPAVVCAPVTVELSLLPEVVRERIAAVRAAVLLEVGPDGEARLRWSRLPTWGALVVAPEVAGPTLHLQPGALWLGRRRFTLPRWLPPVRLKLPPFPRGLQLRRVEVGPAEIVLHLVADEWREPVPVHRVIALLAQLGPFD